MNTILTSQEHPIIKYFLKLKESKRFRKETKRIVIFGKKMILDLPKENLIHTLLISDSKFLKLSVKSEKTFQVSEALIKKITQEREPEGIAAEVSLPFWEIKKPIHSLLALDRIQDPGNLGTLLRTALALGWEGVFLLEGTCDPYNDKAMKAAMGATFKLPIISGTLQKLFELAKTHHLTPYAAALQGRSLNSLSPKKNPLLILGNESQGISSDLLAWAEAVTIPIKREMESLNVSSAGAILMYQFLNHKGFL